VRLSLTQYGDSVSAPMHVCPSAQHIEPHWKSPAAQTRLQPAVPAPAGQQKKAPLSREHVSPAPPTYRENRQSCHPQGYVSPDSSPSDAEADLQHQPP
jgi:hypothetical protein